MALKRRSLVLATFGCFALVAASFALWRSSNKALQSSTEPSPSSAPTELVRIDVHTHISVGALQHLKSLMQQNGFHHVVNLSGGTPDTTLPVQLAQAKASGGAISVFMTIPGREMLRPGFGDRISSMLEQAKKMGAIGLKIPKALGLGYTDGDGNLIAVDDPRLDPVFETCARLDMPVSIHVADPKAFWLPANAQNERVEELSVHPSWSFYDQPVPSWNELLNALERRIARHPRTKFISVHFGNAAEEPDRVSRMLRTYPNMYIDTAARVPEFGRHPSSVMRQLFIEFQDRILYGTDLGVGPDPQSVMLGSNGAEPPGPADVLRFFNSTYRYFDSNDQNIESPTPIQGRWQVHGINLPPEVLNKIFSQNAKKLLRLDM
jgi:hypothetical protein